MVCVFCNTKDKSIIAENDLAIAFFDKYPVNEGHVLIIPKRHVSDFFLATTEELQDINNLLCTVKEILDKKFKPTGYNIGVNVGKDAGQTIFHLHFHLIPRYPGDVNDPRGGIRNLKENLIPYPQGENQ